jgi:hypothetical protein
MNKLNNDNDLSFRRHFIKSIKLVDKALDKNSREENAPAYVHTKIGRGLLLVASLEVGALPSWRRSYQTQFFLFYTYVFVRFSHKYV